MADIKERLDNLRIHIQEPEFLEGKGLSNEVNIRIFCYDAANEMTVRQFIDQITTDQTIACHLVECNLYETFLHAALRIRKSPLPHGSKASKALDDWDQKAP